MTKQPTLAARIGAWFACASFVALAASCQKIIGIEDLEACDCYSGLPETKNVGACKPGCPGDGGVCTGEILPQTEDCSTPTSTRTATARPPAPANSSGMSAGDSTAASAPGIILVPATTAGVLLAGSSVEQVEINGKSLDQKNAVMSFVTALDASGRTPPKYITQLAATGKNAAVIVSSLAALPVDQAVVGGAFQGHVAWLSGEPTAQFPSGFVATVDGKSGAKKGGHALLAVGSNSQVHLNAVATLDSGDVFACGDFEGTMTLADGTKLTATERHDG